MYSFNNDYSEGAHPLILKQLFSTNEDQSVGYGLDEHTKRAEELIKKKIDCETADVHILVGGTQANLIAVSSFLRPYEAVIGVETAHIAVHETGAIEATGHKVITVPSVDGKMTAELIASVLERHTDEHMVKPKMVYISNTTEVGTHYTKCEIKELYEFCQEHNLYFYIDGARLASALTVEDNTMFLCDYPNYCDAFYIGGTKNGALFGEALVIVNDNLKEGIRYSMKQKGGLLAKGRLLGIQFETLFTDDLYMKIGEWANQMGRRMRVGIRTLGYPFLYDSYSNQLFPIFPNEVIEQLSKEFVFSVDSKVGEDHSCVRLVTSWATKEEEVDRFLIYLSELTNKEI
ncbi:MAG: aminotransferase class I/II-fold pyridoxal phosphate-dependent enzyme [bacterium]|nr:aminotransferase class I/II-fold pyridoxal phosphate-dependent enzyme [bacterium]